MTKKILTQAGLEKLESELNELKIQRRKEIAEKIKEAREQGDLSENAEYDAAKEEQRHIEGRIAELEALLKNASVVDTDEIDEDSVNVGHTVRVKNETRGIEQTFHLVGASEANSLQGKISNESPIGKALLGHKVGEKVVAEAPVGEIKFKILQIKRSE